MLWSGEQVRGRGSRAASSETENPLEGPGPLSEAETHPRGVKPSSEAETCMRGCQALERGGGFMELRLALERGGVLPEGSQGPTACWATEAFWAVGPSLPWVATTRSIICGLWIRLFAFYYFRKG
jgi:hypothetical protein